MADLGPHKEIISSVYEIAPNVIEDLAQLIEQRGLRTPLSNIVGAAQVQPYALAFQSGGATTVSTTFTNTGLGGGVTNKLRAGQHLVLMQAEIANNNALQKTTLGLQVNGVNPAGGAGGVGGLNATVDGAVSTGPQSVSAFSYTNMTSDENSILPVWAVTGGTGTVYWYQILVVRTGVTAGG